MLGELFTDTHFAPIGFETTGVNSESTDKLLDTNLSHLIDKKFLNIEKIPAARHWFEKR